MNLNQIISKECNLRLTSAGRFASISDMEISEMTIYFPNGCPQVVKLIIESASKYNAHEARIYFHMSHHKLNSNATAKSNRDNEKFLENNCIMQNIRVLRCNDLSFAYLSPVNCKQP